MYSPLRVGYVYHAPTILFFLSLLILGLQLIFPGQFGGIDIYVVLIVLVYFCIFTISFYFCFYFFKRMLTKNFGFYVVTRATRTIYFLIVILSLYLYVTYFDIYSYSSWQEYRNIIIKGYGTGDIIFTVRILTVLFFFSIFIFFIDKKYKFIYLFIIILIPLLLANRNFIVMFAVVYFFIQLNNKRYMTLGLGFFVFFLINLFYVYAFNKGADDMHILVSTALSILHYLVVPLHGFYYSLYNPVDYGSLLTLPSSIVSLMGFESLRDFIYTPFPYTTNVYTLFFSLNYDFGFVGIVIFAFLFGLLHAFLFVKARVNTGFWILYLLSLYSLVMTFFDNTYTVSPGIWIYMLIPLIFFKKVSL